MSTRHILTVGLCCAIANYGYQAVHSQVWLSALERTYFQWWALALLALLVKIESWGEGEGPSTPSKAR